MGVLCGCGLQVGWGTLVRAMREVEICVRKRDMWWGYVCVGAAEPG